MLFFIHQVPKIFTVHQTLYDTVKSGEFHDETHWTITLQQPTAVQVEAASGAVVKGTHLCPAKVTVPAQGL
jgi:hypothetical protein